MWEIVKAGGVLMLPIIICSIVALAIIIERALRLRHEAVIPVQLMPKVLARADRNIVPTEHEIPELASPLGSVIASGMGAASKGVEAMRHHMQATASVEIHRLEKHLSLLGTIGSVSPLLGLLGTVLGIIQSFMAVTAGGTTDPAQLASGISQALITTAAGMFVAIPAIIGLRYFQNKILGFSVEMERLAGQFITIYDHPVVVSVAKQEAAVNQVFADLNSKLTSNKKVGS